MATNKQEAPYPLDLEAIIDGLMYRPGWVISLVDGYDRGQGCVGLTLVVNVLTVNSYNPGKHIRVLHLFGVPAAAYNWQSWQWWVMQCLLQVEQHEAAEFFTVDGVKPYAPNHGPGWDPYIITHLATDLDRRTSWRGEVNA